MSLITLLLATPAWAAGELPAVEVIWKKELGALHVRPPAGEHVAPDAPVTGLVEVDERVLEIAGEGLALGGGLGLSLPGDSARVVQGELSLSLCEDGGTTCRVVDFGFIGTIEGRKGAEYLAVHRPVPREPEPGPEMVALPHPTRGLSVDQALQIGADEGRPVLIDFSAVWCPPCNLLSAQVLEDPDNADELAPFVLAMVDVDRPDSWEVKSRYEVGGYPTVLVVDGSGSVVSRLEGYPGEEAFLAWLAESARAGSLDELLPRADTLEPAERSRLALRLAREERLDDARSLYEGAQDGVELRMARLLTEQKDADLRWLAENGGERILEWVWSVMDVEATPETVEALKKATHRSLSEAEGSEIADLLYIQAMFSTDDQKPLLYAAAAAALRSSLSGDPNQDRGYWNDLVSLYEGAGRPDLARAVLRQAMSVYPHEFTWFYSAAGLEMRLGDYTQALPFILAAESLGYGDMRLRAAKRHAEVLVGLEQRGEALAVLQRTLEDADRPGDEHSVRTSRYLSQLEELRDELAEQAAQ